MATSGSCYIPKRFKKVKKFKPAKMKFLTNLCLLFIGLKLCHQIDWSWWMVLLPKLTAIGVNLAGLWLHKYEEDHKDDF